MCSIEIDFIQPQLKNINDINVCVVFHVRCPCFSRLQEASERSDWSSKPKKRQTASPKGLCPRKTTYFFLKQRLSPKFQSLRDKTPPLCDSWFFCMFLPNGFAKPKRLRPGDGQRVGATDGPTVPLDPPADPAPETKDDRLGSESSERL